MRRIATFYFIALNGSYTERPLRRARPADSNTVFTVLVAVSVSHLLNDLIQSLLPAIYPLLKTSSASTSGTSA